MTQQLIRVPLDRRSYDIAVSSGGEFGPFFRDRTASMRSLIVADENTYEHAEVVWQSLKAIGVESAIATVPAGETSKSLEMANRLYDRLAEMPADRATPVIAVGGGVVGDLAGFVAATFNRGLPVFIIPTSLLAMVDSSVGGKVGINHRLGKNLIGAFHQPIGVWIDIAHLSTLPIQEFRGGLAEVVKYGMILDKEFFAWLENTCNGILEQNPVDLQKLVERCCQLKAQVVAEDEREETGRRIILNYGHTFAHAFEHVAGYGNLSHGDAVAIGMVCAARLAETMGLTNSAVNERQTELLRQFGLPVKPSSDWPIDKLLAAMRRDKKAANGKLRFVLPREVGRVEIVDDVPESSVAKLLANLCVSDS